VCAPQGAITVQYATSMLKTGLKKLQHFFDNINDIDGVDVCDQPTSGEFDMYTTDNDACRYIFI